MSQEVIETTRFILRWLWLSAQNLLPIHCVDAVIFHFNSCSPFNVDLNVGVPEQVPCGTPLPPSQMSCGWAAACSPWSCDTLSPPCFRAPQWLPPLQRCSPPRRPRWPRPRCFGSRGDAGGGCLCGGYSRLDSRWPRRTAIRPALSTPGYWPTPFRSLQRRHRHHLLENDHTYKNKLMRIVMGDIADLWAFGPEVAVHHSESIVLTNNKEPLLTWVLCRLCIDQKAAPEHNTTSCPPSAPEWEEMTLHFTRWRWSVSDTHEGKPVRSGRQIYKLLCDTSL